MRQIAAQRRFGAVGFLLDEAVSNGGLVLRLLGAGDDSLARANECNVCPPRAGMSARARTNQVYARFAVLAWRLLGLCVAIIRDGEAEASTRARPEPMALSEARGGVLKKLTAITEDERQIGACFHDRWPHQADGHRRHGEALTCQLARQIA